MFRGKESSNRIELSQLVQDLLNFGILGSLRLWGWGVDGWGWGVVGGTPHTRAHAHACKRTHTQHTRMLNMIISCKWRPHWGNPWEFPMMSYAHVRACMCACAHVCGGTLSPLPTHIHPAPPPPGGDPRNHSKFNST